MKQYVWNVRNSNNRKEQLLELAENLKIHSVFAQILAQRNIVTSEHARAFFNPRIKNTHNPFLMKHMHEATSRIIHAITTHEKILVYGDYDVDGTTAIACMYSFLKTRTPHVDFYVPDRYTEGYGVSMKGIDFAIENQYNVIITLDCGIKAHTTIQKAQKAGIDVIVCDHHEPDVKIPPAYAILNPKQNDCNYPCKHLSGCGVGFKLIHALCLTLNLNLKEHLYTYLDILAVSIASDIVPIVDENRIFMYYGLRKLQKSPHIGLKAMLNTTGIQDSEISVRDVVFKIAPRINAAGRIFNARKAIELLISSTYDEAMKLCAYIDEYNMERREIDAKITEEALQIIAENPEAAHSTTTVLYKPEWHKGVIGIVASRVIEQHYKPTIILCGNDDIITGSARSVQGFDIYAALDSCKEYMLHFGGHMYAAGMSLKKTNLHLFQHAFESAVANTITEAQKQPSIEIDAELHISDITPQFYSVLTRFTPFGPENMTPVFMLRGVIDTGKTCTVGADKSHVKFHITHPHNPDIQVQGIGFGLAEKWNTILQQSQQFDVCFTLQENVFRNTTTIQLEVRDIRATE